MCIAMPGPTGTLPSLPQVATVLPHSCEKPPPILTRQQRVPHRLLLHLARLLHQTAFHWPASGGYCFLQQVWCQGHQRRHATPLQLGQTREATPRVKRVYKMTQRLPVRCPSVVNHYQGDRPPRWGQIPHKVRTDPPSIEKDPQGRPPGLDKHLWFSQVTLVQVSC